jgi:sugar/nucleoside kinase (ribokinase family)
MTASIGRLVSVGNVVIDVIANVPALPERGGDVLATSSSLSAGGGFNVLVAAVRQGLVSAYGGAHGIGPFGDLARRSLESEHIEILLEPTEESDTGYDVALVDSDGERTLITAPGAEATLTVARISKLRPRIDDAVYVSGYSLVRAPNREAITGWLRGIPDAITVFVDPGPLVGDIPESTYDEVRARADWWSCNHREATIATGLDDPEQAILALHAQRPSNAVIVRVGANGALVAMPDGRVTHVPGFSVDVRDTNGAGDAHAGGFLAALAAGETPVDAVRRANACAALAVTRSGPATAPTRADVDRLCAMDIR